MSPIGSGTVSSKAASNASGSSSGSMRFEMNAHAPRLSASRAVSSESTAERTAILTDGIRSRSSRMHVSPSIPGIRRSSTTRSGSVCWTTGSTWLPDSATPTISNSGPASAIPTASIIRPWSSATTTLSRRNLIPSPLDSNCGGVHRRRTSLESGKHSRDVRTGGPTGRSSSHTADLRRAPRRPTVRVGEGLGEPKSVRGECGDAAPEGTRGRRSSTDAGGDSGPA